jgi:predicted dithiol-disulfide oxidoreductase (DUF899 family)
MSLQNKALLPVTFASSKMADFPAHSESANVHNGKIRHFWGSEISFAPLAPKQHHRAGDLVDPLWGLLDMTPEGRGDLFPKVNYD